MYNKHFSELPEGKGIFLTKWSAGNFLKSSKFIKPKISELKKPNHIVFVLIVCLGMASCSASKKTAERLPGNWQPVPITVDGKNNDWPLPHPDYDEKAMLGYAISNDKENLYIVIETGDLATQLKILQGGLTVWIDRKAEKNEETAINYPIPQEKDKNKTKGKQRRFFKQLFAGSAW